MNWYYVDGPSRVGPIGEPEWLELVRSGKIQPDTLVWHRGMANWTAYGKLTADELPDTEEPEPESQDAVAALSPEAAEAQAHAEEVAAYVTQTLDRDYSVSLGRSLAKAGELFRSHFWMLVGSTLLTYAIIMLGNSIPVLEVIMAFSLNGVLLGGLYYLYLRLMRGDSAGVSDLFAGFEQGVFRHLAMKTLIATLVSIGCLIPVAIALSATGMIGPEGVVSDADPMAMIVVLLVMLACSIPLVYFAYCWVFALPLIVDKRIPFGPAMRLSRKKVLQHPWRVSVLISLAGLLVILPSVLLFIGLGLSGWGGTNPLEMRNVVEISTLPLVFTGPFYLGVLLSLYEEIFGEPHSEEPPVEEPSPEN